MKRRKRRAAIIAGLSSVLAGLCVFSIFAVGQAAVPHVKDVVPFSKEIVMGFVPPMVTLINRTGEEMRDVMISVGGAERRVADLREGQMKTIAIWGKFTEGSTRVAWRDASGSHAATADDYLAPDGSCHSEIVITSDRKAKAVTQGAS